MDVLSTISDLRASIMQSNETNAYQDNDLAEFTMLAEQFGKYHQDPTNVILHMITTPFGIFGFLGLFMYVTQSTTATSFLCLTYLLQLVATVPTGVFCGTLAILAACLFFAHRNKLGLFSSLLVIALAYAAQDLAHIIVDEKTFQATYSAGGHVSETRPDTRASFIISYLLMYIPFPPPRPAAFIRGAVD